MMAKIFRTALPFVLLSLILLAVFILLAARDLDLGFVGDILGVEHAFGRLGVRQGIQFTFLDDRKHLLLGIFYSAIYALWPGQSAAWYGSSIFLHFANSLLVYALANTLQRSRWLSFAAALAFAFHVRQIDVLFDIATGGHQKIAFGLTLLALLFHIRYLRAARRHNLWHGFSILCYMLGIFLYETTLLYFLLIPVINRFIDPPQSNRRAWLLQTLNDMFWYPILFAFFWLLYTLLVSESPARFALTPAHLLAQFGGALRAEFWPGEWLTQAGAAFSSAGFGVTLLCMLPVILGITLWQTTSRNEGPGATLAIVGAGAFLANVLAVAPGHWSLDTNPRLVYPAAMGVVYIVLGGLVWAMGQLRLSTTFKALIFATAAALMTGPGVATLFHTQEIYLNEDHARQQVITAIREIVPSFDGTIPPYLLLVSDIDPDAYSLHAQDIRFPFMFDLAYGAEGILADAVYYDVPQTFPPEARPAPDLPMSRYIGPYIVVEKDAIYSPLRPGLPIDPERLVVIGYDSVSGRAELLDRVPNATLETGNIILREGAPPLVTNFDLIGGSP